MFSLFWTHKIDTEQKNNRTEDTSQPHDTFASTTSATQQLLNLHLISEAVSKQKGKSKMQYWFVKEIFYIN